MLWFFFLKKKNLRKCPTAAVPTVGMSQCASNRFSGTKEKKQIKLEKEKQQNSKKTQTVCFTGYAVQQTL